MILTPREKYEHRVYRKLNCNPVYKKKYTHDDLLDKDETNTSEIELRNLEAKQVIQRFIEKQEKFKAGLEFTKKNLLRNIRNYLRPYDDNRQICIKSDSCMLIENYTKEVDRYYNFLIKRKYINHIYNWLCTFDENECDTIMFLIHNSKLRACKYKNFTYVSEIHPKD